MNQELRRRNYNSTPAAFLRRPDRVRAVLAGEQNPFPLSGQVHDFRDRFTAPDTLGLRLVDEELPFALAVWNVIPSC